MSQLVASGLVSEPAGELASNRFSHQLAFIIVNELTYSFYYHFTLQITFPELFGYIEVSRERQ